MKHKSVLLAVALLAMAGVVRGQSSRAMTDIELDSLKQSHKIIEFGQAPAGQDHSARLDSMRQLVEMFYYDQFRHFQDPAAPYFLFMSRDSQLAMGVGGCVRMRGWFDWGGAIDASGFAPYLIEMSPDPTHHKKFGTTPAGSSLFFRVIGRNKKLGNYQLYIEANFNGYGGRDFHLKKAYAMINDWTIGYANSTFSDPGALAPTVDAQGPNNKISPTNVLIRRTFDLHKGWLLALSLETPSTSVDDSSTDTEKVDEWLPDAAAFMQYSWSESSHLRAAAILRTLSYRDLLKNKNHNVMGWGAMLTTVAHPHPQITCYGGVSGGKGIASLGGDLQIGKLDLVNTPSEPGMMYAPASLGWNIGLQYNFTPALFVSASYAENHLYSKHGTSTDQYKYGRFIAVNAFWNLTPRIQTGVEFDLGERKNLSGQHRWARRIGAMCQFSF